MNFDKLEVAFATITFVIFFVMINAVLFLNV